MKGEEEEETEEMKEKRKEDGDEDVEDEDGEGGLDALGKKQRDTADEHGAEIGSILSEQAEWW